MPRLLEENQEWSARRKRNWLSRVSVSGVCTNNLSLEQDLGFWERHRIVDVGIPLRKVGSGDADRVAACGLRVSNLLAWGPRLDDRSSWPEYRELIESAFEQATTMPR